MNKGILKVYCFCKKSVEFPSPYYLVNIGNFLLTSEPGQTQISLCLSARADFENYESHDTTKNQSFEQ